MDMTEGAWGWTSAAEELCDRERAVLIHRYGVMGGLPRTQREVASMLGISRSYVSRIEKKALEKLRDSLTPDP